MSAHPSTSSASGSTGVGNNPNSCPICGKGLKTRKSLETHKATHNKPFHCSHCPKRSATSLQMKQHIFKVHRENVDEYVCYMPDCSRAGFAYINLHHLYLHLVKEHNATLEDNERAAADSEKEESVKEGSEEEEGEEEEGHIEDDTSMVDSGNG
ncbi:hypothetical protein PG984_005163 [Apiospora sp. TS-2023a]